MAGMRISSGGLCKLGKAIQRLVLRGARRPREAAADARHLTMTAVRHCALKGVGNGLGIQWVGPGHFVMAEMLGKRRDARYDRRCSTGQGLQRSQAEAF